MGLGSGFEPYYAQKSQTYTKAQRGVQMKSPVTSPVGPPCHSRQGAPDAQLWKEKEGSYSLAVDAALYLGLL